MTNTKKLIKGINSIIIDNNHKLHKALSDIIIETYLNIEANNCAFYNSFKGLSQGVDYGDLIAFTKKEIIALVKFIDNYIDALWFEDGDTEFSSASLDVCNQAIEELEHLDNDLSILFFTKNEIITGK